jgi:hypothetical protein
MHLTCLKSMKPAEQSFILFFNASVKSLKRSKLMPHEEKKTETIKKLLNFFLHKKVICPGVTLMSVLKNTVNQEKKKKTYVHQCMLFFFYFLVFKVAFLYISLFFFHKRTQPFNNIAFFLFFSPTFFSSFIVVVGEEFDWTFYLLSSFLGNDQWYQAGFFFFLYMLIFIRFKNFLFL